MSHAPSTVRALIAEAKRGGRPTAILLKEARSIPEPSHAAEALFGLSEFVQDKQAGHVLDEVADLVGTIERGWRKAEVLSMLAKKGPTWRDGDVGLDETLARFQDRVVRIAFTLDGKELLEALPAVARWCPPELMPELLRHALEKGSDPLEAGKRVLGLGEAPGVVEAIRSWPDASLRARLLAYHHNHNPQPLLEEAIGIAGTLPAKDQVEVIRGIVASLAGDDLTIVHEALGDDPEVRARLLAALAARADKVDLPDLAAAWFAEGFEVAKTVADPKAREAIAGNISKGAERLRTGKPAPASAPTPPTPVTAIRAAAPSSKRPILAIVDTYDGKLGETHLRAVGRAAPLCWAFGLDLALVGFPGGLDQTVRKAAKETHIGEGEGYVSELAAAGRIHWIPAGEDGSMPTWPGLPIATTPSPDVLKALDFATAAERAHGRPLVVLMGLGKRGLPASWLKGIPHHLELTGKRVSLETATAMGILAERMRLLAT